MHKAQKYWTRGDSYAVVHQNPALEGEEIPASWTYNGQGGSPLKEREFANGIVQQWKGGKQNNLSGGRCFPRWSCMCVRDSMEHAYPVATFNVKPATTKYPTWDHCSHLLGRYSSQQCQSWEKGWGALATASKDTEAWPHQQPFYLHTKQTLYSWATVSLQNH